MPYLIDGHNLIPFISGLSLDLVDDEMELIQLLVPFFRRINKKAVVYFDKAFPGAENSLNRGNLSVRFIRPPRIADQAILADLTKMGGDVKNCTVVSSDHKLRASAVQAGARVISSDEFSRILSGKKPVKPPENSPIDDIDHWLRLFKDRTE